MNAGALPGERLETRRGARHANAAVDRRIHIDDDLAGHDVWIGQERADVVDGRDRNASLGEGGHDSLQIVATDPAFHETGQCRAIGGRIGGLAFRPGSPDPHHLEQPDDLGGGVGGGDNPSTVLGPEGSAESVTRSGRCARLEGDDLRRDSSHDRFKHRDFDVLALAARDGTPVAGGQGAHHSGQGGEAVAEQRGRRGWVVGGEHAREPSEGLGNRAVATAFGIGPIAPAGHVHHDRSRVSRPDRIVGAVHSLEHRSRLVHDDDVRSGRQPAQQSDAVGTAMVDRHHALVSRDQRPHTLAVIGAPGGDGTKWLSLRGLHLHHVGPEVAEHGADERARVEVRQLEHREAVERGRRPHWGIGLVGRR